MTELPGSDLPETQYERTQLAWRRTMIGVLAVVGIGGIHLSTMNHPALGILAGAVAMIALVPIVSRIGQLRRHETGAATWQPAVLVIALLVLAGGLFVLG